MRRILIYVIQVAALVALAVWLSFVDGKAQMVWGNYVLTTTTGKLVFLFAGMVGVTATVSMILGKAIYAPGLHRRLREAEERARGYAQLNHGLIAAARGDVNEARRCGQRARASLGNPPMAMLLSAQFCGLAGDEDSVRKHYAALAQREESSFLGIRGLLAQALRLKDNDRALRLAERARLLEPKAGWAYGILFREQVRAGMLAEAEETLIQGIRQKALPRELGRRHHAVLLIARSHAAHAAGNVAEAVDLAEKAHDLMPTFVPAAIGAARIALAAGKRKNAEKMLEKAYQANPHEDLVAAWRDLAANQAPETLLPHMLRLNQFAREHRLTRLAIAETAIMVKDWATARRKLDAAFTDGEQSAFACRLMAELEQGEHGDSVKARHWLLRAVGAPDDKHWACTSCGSLPEKGEWLAICATCGAFDALEWIEVDESPLQHRKDDPLLASSVPSALSFG